MIGPYIEQFMFENLAHNGETRPAKAAKRRKLHIFFLILKWKKRSEDIVFWPIHGLFDEGNPVGSFWHEKEKRDMKTNFKGETERGLRHLSSG